MELQHVLVCFMFLSVSFVEAARKCDDLITCIKPEDTHLFSQIGPDSIPPEVCGKIPEIMQCLDETLADCKASGGQNQMITSMEQMQAGFQTYQPFCDGSGSMGGPSGSGSMGGPSGSGSMGGPSGAETCAGVIECLSDMANFQALVEEKKISEACPILIKVMICGQKALAECQQTQHTELNSVFQLVNKHCPDEMKAIKESFFVSGQDGQSGMYNVSAAEFPKEPTCNAPGLQKCAAGIDKDMKNMTESELKEVCKIMPSRLECLEDTIAVCEKSSIMAVMLDEVKKALEQGKNEYNEKCKDGAGAIQFSWTVLAAAFLTLWHIHARDTMA